MKKRRWKKVLALTMSFAMVLTLPLSVAAESCTCEWKCESNDTAGCDVCKLDHAQCNATDVYINPTCNCTSLCTDDSNKNNSCPLCNDGARNCQYTSPDFTAPDASLPEVGYVPEEIGWTGGDDSDEITVGGIDAALKDGSIRFGRDGSEDLFAKLKKEDVTIDLDEHGAVSVTLRKPDGETSKKPKREIYIVGAGLRYEFSPIEFESIFNSAPGQSVTLEVKQYNEKKAENLLDQNRATMSKDEIEGLAIRLISQIGNEYYDIVDNDVDRIRDLVENLTLTDLRKVKYEMQKVAFLGSDRAIAALDTIIKEREAALKTGDQISEDAEILGATEFGATSAGKLIGLNGISLSFKPKSYLNREDIATMALKALEEKKLVYSTTGGVGHKDAEGNFVKEAQLGIYQKNTDGSLTSVPPAVGLDLGKATISHQAEANKVYIYTLSPVD